MFLFTLHNCNIFFNIIHVTFLILEFTLEICTEQSLPDLLLSTVNLQDKTDHPITRYCLPVSHGDLFYPTVKAKIDKMGKEYRSKYDKVNLKIIIIFSHHLFTNIVLCVILFEIIIIKIFLL